MRTSLTERQKKDDDESEKNKQEDFPASIVFVVSTYTLRQMLLWY